MKYLYVSVVLLFIVRIADSQSPPKFDFTCGYGFYEGYFVGSEFHFQNSLHSVSLSAGYDKSFRKNAVSYSLALGYDYALFKSHKDRNDRYMWSVSSRAVLWQLEDEHYLWRAVSLIYSIRRKFSITQKISMSLDVGPAFTIVLSNKRKTYEEVGWPYNYMPNFRISFIL
jgi:hypothetical protein